MLSDLSYWDTALVMFAAGLVLVVITGKFDHKLSDKT